MKVSLNIVKFYNEKYNSSPDPYSYGVDEVLRRIGAQLGAVEEVTYFGHRFNGVVVARIMSCVKHPDADKLNVCRVDDGGAVEKLWFDLCKELVDDNIEITQVSKSYEGFSNYETIDNVNHLRVKGYDSVNAYPKRLFLDFSLFFAVQG